MSENERANEIVAQIHGLDQALADVLDQLSQARKRASAGLPAPEGLGKQRRELKDQRDALLEELKEVDPERYVEEWNRLYGWEEELPELPDAPGEEDVEVIIFRKDAETTDE